MLTLAQSLRQQGRVEGRVKERRELILQMLKNGADVSTIARLTEQQPEDIERILIKWKQEEIA